MKELVFLLLGMFFLSNSCFAMTFQQPIRLGMLNVSQVGVGSGGMLFEGASHNIGDYFTKYKYNHGNTKTYGKGIARYGNGTDALYIYYNMYEESFTDTHLGGNDIKNTIHVPIFCDVIYKITSDEGVTLYPVQYIYGPASRFTVIGRQKDGKFVKYIDLGQISKTYLGLSQERLDTEVHYALPVCQGDTIIFSYERKNGIPGRYVGAFKFKWDDQAQWFGIEHILY